MNTAFGLTPLFLLALSVFLLQSAIATDPLFNICSKSYNYTANSLFSKNLNHALASLEIKAPLTGFATSSVGKSSDRAYGLALCRGDVSRVDCKSCINNARNQVIHRCPYAKQGMVWFDNCQLRYSNVDFLGTIDNQNKFYLWNTQNVSEPVLFNRQLGELLHQLSVEAAVRPSLYAMGEIGFRDYQKIYGLAQCTRDLTSGQCHDCLDTAIADIPSCCDGKQGGRVVGGSCTIRYELYPFLSS